MIILLPILKEFRHVIFLRGQSFTSSIADFCQDINSLPWNIPFHLYVSLKVLIETCFQQSKQLGPKCEICISLGFFNIDMKIQ